MPSTHRASDDLLPPWLSVRWLWRLAAAMALVLTALAGTFLAYEREAVRGEAFRNAALHARVLSDWVDRSVDGTLAALASVADGIDPDQPSRWSNEQLAQSARNLTLVRNLHVVSADGTVLASSNPSAVGQRLNGLRGHEGGVGRWKVLGAVAGRDLSDARPLSPGAKRLAVPLAMRLPHPGANQGWMLVAVLNPDQMATQFDLLLQGAGLAGLLIQMDGHVLAATNEWNTPLGARWDVDQDVLATLQSQSAGTGAVTERGQSEALMAYRHTRYAPWIVLVRKPTSAVEEAFQSVVMQVFGVWIVALGALVGFTVAGSTSIRAYERQRSARQEASRELMRQHALISSVMEASPTALYAKDGEGRLLLANRAWGRLAGLNESQWVGQALPASASVADPIHPNRSDADILQAGSAESFEVTVPTPIGQRDMLVSKASVIDPNGSPVALVGSLTDISAVRETERRSRAAAEAERRANDAKTEFVANMSHELRTPLQSIIGFAELGLHRSPDSPFAQNCFGRVHDAGRHMLSLVEDLLDLSRSDLTSDRHEHTVQELGPLVQEVLQELMPQAQRRQVSWAGPDNVHSRRARIDARGFKQVVRNVAANAIRFAPEGSEVALAWTQRPGGVLRLSVSDRGPGVPEDEREAIFAPFVQSTLTKTHAGGTGLGLAICRRIMTAFEGRIWVEARQGGGATFHLELPGS